MQSKVKFCDERHAVFDHWLNRVIGGKVWRTCLSHTADVLLLIDGYSEALVDVAAAKISLAKQGAGGAENREKRIAVTSVVCGAVIGCTRCRKQRQIEEVGSADDIHVSGGVDRHAICRSCRWIRHRCRARDESSPQHGLSG